MAEQQPTPNEPLTQRNRLLARIALDGWNNQTSGDVSRVSITEAELPELTEAFAEDLEMEGLADPSVLAGHFLVTVTVTEFGSESEVIRAYEEQLKSHQ